MSENSVWLPIGSEPQGRGRAALFPPGRIVLYHPDVGRHGFQFVDWLFEGEDMIVVSRAVLVTGWEAPPRQHDANYLTFQPRELPRADNGRFDPGRQAG